MLDNNLIGDSTLLNINDDIDGLSGKLSATTLVQVHTNHGRNLLLGKQAKHKQSMAFGLKQIGFNLNTMMKGSASDCPYADYFFCELEERIQVANDTLHDIKQRATNVLESSLPDGFASALPTNDKPFKQEFRSANPLAYRLVFLLLEIDKYVRIVTTMGHFGLISNKKKSDDIELQMNSFRSIVHFIKQYSLTGITRNDIAANNERARECKDKYKNIEIPEDILRGERRSEFAPVIRNEQAHDEFISVRNLASIPESVETGSDEKPLLESAELENE